jgi:hypothetical protein
MLQELIHGGTRSTQCLARYPSLRFRSCEGDSRHPRLKQPLPQQTCVQYLPRIHPVPNFSLVLPRQKSFMRFAGYVQAFVIQSRSHQPCWGPCSNILKVVQPTLHPLSSQLLLGSFHLFSKDTGPTRDFLLNKYYLLYAIVIKDLSHPYILALLPAMKQTHQTKLYCSTFFNS